MPFALAYLVAAALPIALTRYDGGVAFIWIASALLTAKLALRRQAHWWPILALCGLASALATWTVGLGPMAAVPLALVNVGEGAIGALILRRYVSTRAPLESPRWLAVLVLGVGIAAPAISGLAGAAVAHWLTGGPYWSNWTRWFFGHGLGTVAFLPIASFVFRGQLREWRRVASIAHMAEIAALLVLVAATSIGVFAQSTMPLLFLPMLPIMLTTFRGGRLGAAVSVVLLSVIGGVLTLSDHGPIALMNTSQGTHIQFLQFYLAVTVLIVLPVAAELARRKTLHHRLTESEARYRLLTDNSTDIVLDMDVDGNIRFASPSIAQFGPDPADLVGVPATTLVDPRFVDVVTAVHVDAFRAPLRTFTVEYVALTASLGERWFESHTRAVTGGDGRIDGFVSTIRDISRRKSLEDRLEQAAYTDALTGLANRRRFMEELVQRTIAEGAMTEGCVAMLDLDHFKRVNDLHGHDAGDEVLRAFAEIARSSIREDDLVARLGGEEFAIILPGATMNQAVAVCGRLRQAVADAVFTTQAGRVSLTVSGGVARYVRGSIGSVVLREADAALYDAKNAGRNRLALAA